MPLPTQGRFGRIHGYVFRGATFSENIRHSIKTGLYKHVGSKNRLAKLNEEKVAEMKKLREEQGLTVRELGKLFGVAPQTAWSAVTGRKWQHVSANSNNSW